MSLPTKALLVTGLLLSSAEASAQYGTFRPAHGDGVLYRQTDQYRPVPAGFDDKIRRTQGKRPVDVLSLSLGGALISFFALALLQRRRNARIRRAREGELPVAQALTSGDFDVRD